MSSLKILNTLVRLTYLFREHRCQRTLNEHDRDVYRDTFLNNCGHCERVNHVRYTRKQLKVGIRRYK